MSLATKVETAVMNELDKCDSVGYGPNSLESFIVKNKEAITNLYKGGVLNDNLMDCVVIRKIVDETKLYMKKMTVTKDTNAPFYARDVPRPEFLAYVIDNRIFSEHVIKKVLFSFDGWTPEYFAQVYRKRDVDIVTEVRKELLRNL
jgi:hypothetical protein